MNKRRVIVEYLDGLYYTLRFQFSVNGDWADHGNDVMAHTDTIQRWIDNWIQSEVIESRSRLGK